MTLDNILRAFAISLIIVGLGIMSCKKQEVVKSTVQFSSPTVGQPYQIGSSVLLKASVRDDDNILLLKSFLLGPAGDTVENIVETRTDLSTLFEITYRFDHGQNYYRTGDFTWYVIVSNRFETTTFKRSFQVGEKVAGKENFAIVSFDKNTRPANFDLYKRENNSLVKFDTYSISSEIYRANSLGEYIYAREGNELVYWNGFSGTDKKTLISPVNNSTTLRSLDKMYVSNYKFPSLTSSYNTNGTLDLNIQNRFGESKNILRVGQTIFSVEYDQSDGRTKLVTYSTATGGYLGNVPIQRYVNIYGLFSFGNKNRVYLMTQDPSNSSQTAFWYYNKSLNAIAQLSFTISAQAVAQNPINISSTEAWLFTDRGIYEYNSGDQVSISPTSSPNSNITNASSYSYLESEKLLMYKSQSSYHIYDVSAGKEIGKIANGNGTVMFLKK